MVTSRGAFFLGLSLIICVAMLIYGPQIGKFRYLTVPTNQGLFILDTKTQMMNVCTEKNCRIVPHEATGGMVPIANGMQPTYGQMQMASVNSLGIVENPNNMMGGFACGNGVCVMPSMIAPQQQTQFQMQPVVQAKPPKPAEPMVIEQQPEPEVLEMVAPPRPAAAPFVAVSATPPVPTAPIMRQPPVGIQERPVPAPMTMAQPPIRPIVQTPPPPINPADQRVTNDMAQLQATEDQALLGR